MSHKVDLKDYPYTDLQSLFIVVHIDGSVASRSFSAQLSAMPSSSPVRKKQKMSHPLHVGEEPQTAEQLISAKI